MRLVLFSLVLASTAAAQPAQRTVHFTTGSTRVPDSADNAIVASARAQSTSNGILIIEGYASPAGSRADNLRLSQQRTEAVRTALVSAGADPDRIMLVAHGEDRPDRSGPTGPVVVIRSDSFALSSPAPVQARTSPARTRSPAPAPAPVAARPAPVAPAPTVVVVVPPAANNALTTRALWEPLAPVYIAPSATSADVWPAGDPHGGTIGNASVSPPGAALGETAAQAATTPGG